MLFSRLFSGFIQRNYFLLWISSYSAWISEISLQPEILIRGSQIKDHRSQVHTIRKENLNPLHWNCYFRPCIRIVKSKLVPSTVPWLFHQSFAIYSGFYHHRMRHQAILQEICPNHEPFITKRLKLFYWQDGWLWLNHRHPSSKNENFVRILRFLSECFWRCSTRPQIWLNSSILGRKL